MVLRVLLVADTHLGFDEPKRAGSTRLRRGADFFRNLELALQPALNGAADLVIHAGDVFDRSKVPPDLVERAFAPMKRVADTGVPVVVVPGNHERSVIPYPLLAMHPQITIVKRPITLRMELAGLIVAISAWPTPTKSASGSASCLQRQITLRISTPTCGCWCCTKRWKAQRSVRRTMSSAAQPTRFAAATFPPDLPPCSVGTSTGIRC